MYATLVYSNGKSKRVPVQLRQHGAEVVASLSRDVIGSEVDYVDFMPEYFCARTGDPGYYVIPGTVGEGTRITRFSQRPDMEYTPELTHMGCIGFYKGDEGILAIADGLRFDFNAVVGVKNGKYYAYPRYKLDGDLPDEDISVLYCTLQDGTYSNMAARYRQFKFERCGMKPLKDRIKDNPVLKQAADGPEIRIRQAWKPVPSPIEYQTEANEPDLHVACSFQRAGDIVKAFHEEGLEGGEFCLVGWNYGGHDGRFPQIFPPDPRLGGGEEMEKLIRTAKENRYLIVCHTSSTAAYTIADCWDTEYLLKNKDGSLHKRPYCWGGGRPHKICPRRQYERFDTSDLPALRELGFSGLHYIDVMSILPLLKCYDANHPVNRRETAQWYKKTMELCRKQIGGFASEGSYDFAAEDLDYCLYTIYHDLDKQKQDIFDEPIPFFQLVYHGSILYNPSTDTLNYGAKASDNRLKFFEYGGRPLVVYYANFAKGHNWMGKEDFVCETDEQLNDSVKKIRVMYDDYNELKDVRYAFMDKHEKLSDDQVRVTYSNGTQITVDYQTKQAEIVHADGKRSLIQC